MILKERPNYTETGKSSNSISLGELTTLLFQADQSTSDFVSHFNNHFPMPQAFLSDKRFRFNASKIRDLSKISCEASAILTWNWIKAHQDVVSIFFLTRQIANQDSHVYTVTQEESGVWLYHLTDFSGLKPVKASTQHNQAILQAQGYPVDSIAGPHETYIPQYQIFTNPSALEDFFVIDYQRRASRLITGLMYDD